jgi:hypothetical protein
VGEMRKAYCTSVGKPEEEISVGKTRSKCDNNWISLKINRIYTEFNSLSVESRSGFL